MKQNSLNVKEKKLPKIAFSHVGSKMKILVEKISDNSNLIGRFYNFAPEIYGNVILSSNANKNFFKIYW